MVRPHTYSDYQEMCHYHQTSPESHFTKSRVCTRATPDGRITLSGLRFITTTMAGREERTLPDENEYEQLLREEFGIEMNRSAAGNSRLG